MVNSRAKWIELVKGQEASGQSAAEYCRNQLVNVSQFFYWRDKLKRQSESKLIRVHPAEVNDESIIIEACGAKVKLPLGAPVEVIEKVLGVINASHR